MATRPATSSIAMALAGKTPSMDIPKPRATQHDTPGQTGPRHGQPAMLPTPPSSISPSFHPQGFKHHANLPDSPPSAPLHVDSDIDLQDTADNTGYRERSVATNTTMVVGSPDSLAALDSAGDISSGMLAKYHLPDILVNHGPLAIRHIMGYLTTSVPGFSMIPPAKARRLVVGGLEGRGATGEDGGVHSDVEFEKVGWGRWDAKRRGLSPRDNLAGHASPRSTPAVAYRRDCLEYQDDGPTKNEARYYGSSLTGESAVFSHSNFGFGDHADDDLLEHPADQMSLDGDERVYCSSSEASDNDLPMDGDWDEADLTDEEDWAEIGAAALRARSFPDDSIHNPDIYDPPSLKSKWRTHGYGGGPSYSALAKSVPNKIPIQHGGIPITGGVGGDVEERAAVEALLQLGSM